jgi:microcystin-dependent protein
MDSFNFSPLSGFLDANQYPDPQTETEARAQFMSLFNQVRDYLNDTVKTTVDTLEKAIPAGTIAYFSMSTAPEGWIKCNGNLIKRTDYPKLFAAIGTTYGAGDSTTTFQLPDLRGEFIRGLDDGRGVDAGRELGKVQEDMLETHKHYIGAGQVQVNIGSSPTYMALCETGGGGGSQYSASTGGAETRPRNIALLACIKY